MAACRVGPAAVAVNQTMVDRNGVKFLRIDWHESGGPEVRIMTSMIGHDVGGSADIVYAARGVMAFIEVPL